jgi:hypothetical protein
MQKQDRSSLINRAIELLRDAYVSQDQPWHWPRQEFRVKKGSAPDAVLVCAEEPPSRELQPEDVLVHTVSICSESSSLYAAGEDEEVSFPLLDDLAGIPGNYHWLAIPDDMDLDEEVMEGLEDECGAHGVGLIVCHMDEDYDEIRADSDVTDGQFLTAYSGWGDILKALSEQLEEPPACEELEEQEEEYNYQGFDYDSSGDYE